MSDVRITEHFRVLAFDLPWHGKSPPPSGWQKHEYRLTSDLYEQVVIVFAAALDLDKPIVMGCSMGGSLVVRLAELYGSMLRAVTGLESSGHPQPWYDGSWLDEPAFLRGDFCDALVLGLVAPQSSDEYCWERLWHYYQSAPGVFKGDMHFYRTDSEYRDSARVEAQTTCPVILMTGAYDYSCTPSLTIESAQRIPGAKAIVMQGLGHVPMSENPAPFYEYLEPVLAELRQRAA